MSVVHMSKRTRVKICGISSVADGLAAAAHGADAIGMVFYSTSQRYVAPELAREICTAMPAFLTLTGLFVNANQAEVEAVLETVPLGLLQFHGEETDSFCQQFGRPYIKALRVRADMNISAAIAAYPGASGVLLDTWVSGIPGGTGQQFDWSLIPGEFASQLILAGGLTPDNVTQAISSVRPYAVDVSGGVESGKGVKDHAAIAAFCAAVSVADQS